MMNNKTLWTLLLWSVSFHLFAQYLTEPQLIKDIATNQQADLQNTFCVANGNQIICSDGAAAGTFVAYTAAESTTTLTVVADFLRPFSYNFNERLLLFTEKTATETRLYSYDLNTIQLLDSGSEIQALQSEYRFDKRILYTKNDNELWLSDFVAPPILLQTLGGEVREFVDQGYLGVYIFTGNNELWLTDYTAAGTRLLKTFSTLGAIGQRLYAADDGGFNGTELWYLDQNSSWMLQNIAPWTASSNPTHFTQGYGSTYFSVELNGVPQIWQLDYKTPESFLTNLPNYGTNSTVSALDFYRTSFRFSQLTIATQVNDNTTVLSRYRFSDNEPALVNIGEVAGRVTEINYPFFKVEHNGQINLWSLINDQLVPILSDVAEARFYQTQRSAYRYLTHAGSLYAINEENNFQLQFIQSFTPSATFAFFPPKTFYYNDRTVDNQWFAVLENGQNTVWRMENGNENVQTVTQFSYPAAELSSQPNTFQVFENQLYFTAGDLENGRRLWRTDLTEAGTVAYPDWSSAIVIYGTDRAIIYDGALYYTTSQDYDQLLYQVVGEELVLIENTDEDYLTILNQIRNQSATQEYLLNGKTYRVSGAGNEPCGRCSPLNWGEIVEVLPDTTRRIFNYSFLGYTARVAPTELTAVYEKFYFLFNEQAASGAISNSGTALYESDGTAAGTRWVRNFANNPQDLVVMDEMLYVLGDDGVNGEELLRINADNSVTILTDFSTAGERNRLTTLYTTNNRLFFIVRTPTTFELWGSDGQTTGATAIAPLLPNPDPHSTNNRFQTPHAYFNGALVFAKDDATVGTELFKITFPEFTVTPASIVSADLSIEQTVGDRSVSLNETRIPITVTVRNNSTVTAENVQINIGNTNGYFSFMDFTVSLGEIDFRSWTIPILAAGESATAQLTLVRNEAILDQLYLVSNVRANTGDLNIENNQASTLIPAVANCPLATENGFEIDFFYGVSTENSPITFDENLLPNETRLQSRGLQGFVNQGDIYTQRAQGYITPTVSGSYIFSISGDDNVDFYLSTDDDPLNKVRLAYIDGWTFPLEYDKYPSQLSTPITIVAGERYYFEVLLSEERGDDHFTVRWMMPNTENQQLIANQFLTPYCTETTNFTCEQVDIERPKVENCPESFTVYLPAGQPTIADWIAPTFTDNCELESVISNYQPGDILPYDHTYIEYVATDRKGNEQRCGFTVERIYTNMQNADNQLIIEGVSQCLLPDFQLYPTLTSDLLTLKIKTELPTLPMTIISAQGQVIQQLSWQNESGVIQQSLSVAHLPPGIYFVSIAGRTQKFVKQ